MRILRNFLSFIKIIELAIFSSKLSKQVNNSEASSNEVICLNENSGLSRPSSSSGLNSSKILLFRGMARQQPNQHQTLQAAPTMPIQ